MALSLNAEQKNLSNLFTGREQFVIPSYQRPYSWEFDQCQKLYDDIVAAYNEKRDYFIGNIILAISDDTKQDPRVVDGQQRLISIWLMFKALSVILPNTRILKDVLCCYNWDGSDSIIKIDSKVFEVTDQTHLSAIYAWTSSNFEMEKENSKSKKAHKDWNQIFANGVYFYNLFYDFHTTFGDKELMLFLRFMLERVFILPIELSAADITDAEDKALNIFETINDRGMNLEDADIFKAKLYNKALNKEEKDEFINQWVGIKDTCRNLKISIDDLFRYYSHIIRGEESNIKSEISLREFFQSADSVLTRKSQIDVVSDLNHILDLLTSYNEKKNEKTILASWLQLIDTYTNNYPRFAVVAYLFHNGFENEEQLIDTLKKIVRYCYYMGSTTMVKYGIYTIIKQVSHQLPVDEYYQENVTIDSFNYLGRLKYGYALLAHYLEQPEAFVYYDTDRLLTSKDIKYLPTDWKGHDLNEHLDDLGNLAILDHCRVLKKYTEKLKIYAKTENTELKQFFVEHPNDISYKELRKRSIYKKKLLVSFFSKPSKK